MRPRTHKYVQDTICSDNIKDVTQMTPHFAKPDDIEKIIKIIYDEDKSRFIIIKQNARQMIIQDLFIGKIRTP